MVNLADWLFPSHCPGCARLCRDGICAACLGAALARCPDIEPIAGLGGVVALGAYGGVLCRCVRLLKYHGRRDLARPLGRELGRRAAAAWAIAPEATWLPIPAAASRVRARRGEHAWLLARAAAQAAGGRFDGRSLRRLRQTPPLFGLDAAERAAILAGAFAVGRPLAGAVVLVDDVLTTGATAAVAAAAARAAGAGPVHLAVVARA